MLIQDTFEVDAVGLDVSRETAEVVSLFVVLGAVFIAVDSEVFSACSPSACFGGMVVHFGVCAAVLPVSVSSSSSSSATSSATATGIISATGV